MSASSTYEQKLARYREHLSNVRGKQQRKKQQVAAPRPYGLRELPPQPSMDITVYDEGEKDALRARFSAYKETIRRTRQFLKLNPQQFAERLCVTIAEIEEAERGTPLHPDVENDLERLSGLKQGSLRFFREGLSSLDPVCAWEDMRATDVVKLRDMLVHCLSVLRREKKLVVAQRRANAGADSLPTPITSATRPSAGERIVDYMNEDALSGLWGAIACAISSYERTMMDRYAVPGELELDWYASQSPSTSNTVCTLKEANYVSGVLDKCRHAPMGGVTLSLVADDDTHPTVSSGVVAGRKMSSNMKLRWAATRVVTSGAESRLTHVLIAELISKARASLVSGLEAATEKRMEWELCRAFYSEKYTWEDFCVDQVGQGA